MTHATFRLGNLTAIIGDNSAYSFPARLIYRENCERNEILREYED
jgi:hypothetical protein